MSGGRSGPFSPRVALALVLGGALAFIALLWAASASLLHKPVEARRIVVDITAWYWHFMAVLWIFVFALLGYPFPAWCVRHETP